MAPFPQLVTIAPSPVHITPVSANGLSNKLAVNAPNNIIRHPPFCSFASFLIVQSTSFISKPNS